MKEKLIGIGDESFAFVYESNLIECISRDPSKAEMDEFYRFMLLPKVTIEELKKFVSVYQPNALLRECEGLNVRVGNHVPVRGGIWIREKLEILLNNAAEWGAWKTHVAYETLHPFTDGNGRSGRMLWAWQMRHVPLGFLHSFYYQTLQNTGR